MLIVDPSSEIYDIPRAVHFDGEVMRIFQAMGLADAVSRLSAPGKKISFTNGKNWTLFEQDLSVVPRHNGWFNNQFFNQPRLEACLREGVSRYPNVAFRSGWALSSLDQVADKVRVQITYTGTDQTSIETEQTELVSARYLLACDGASSLVRTLLAIPQEDLHCDEPWLVCDLMLDGEEEFNRSGLQICDPARPTTLIPCEGNHIRWEFMLNAENEIEGVEEEAAVRAMMAPHLWRLSPNLTAEDGELVRAKVYKFHALIAETFQQGQVFLLGDAAHQTPPFLGQGLCAGVRDAYNLCWKLAGVIEGNHPASILETYTSERRPHVNEVITTAVAHGAIIQARNPLKATVRDCYLMLGRAFPFLVSFLKFGEGWNLGPGLFGIEGAPSPGGAVGEPLPQGRVQQRQDGQPTNTLWSDELLGTGYTLIGFDVDPASLLTKNRNYDGLSTLHIGPEASLQEIEGELMNWATEHAVGLALVRPDRQVFGICRKGPDLAPQLEQLIDRLYRQLEQHS